MTPPFPCSAIGQRTCSKKSVFLREERWGDCIFFLMAFVFHNRGGFAFTVIGPEFACSGRPFAWGSAYLFFIPSVSPVLVKGGSVWSTFLPLMCPTLRVPCPPLLPPCFCQLNSKSAQLAFFCPFGDTCQYLMMAVSGSR